MNTIETLRPVVAGARSVLHPALSALALERVLPMTPAQYAGRLIEQRWGADYAHAWLADLNYDFYGYPAQDNVHRGRVRTSQTLVQALLENDQTVGAGRLGESAFGLYTPPTVGPAVRIVEIDTSTNPGGGYRDYEGIYRPTQPQTYGPDTQLVLQPAAFKAWVWNLDFKERYAAYVREAWPSDQALLAESPCALCTAVKLAFVMAAYLQRQERSLSAEGLNLALRAAGLPADQAWPQLSLPPLQARAVIPASVHVLRLRIYRYASSDIVCLRDALSGRLLLYVPGNASPFHELADKAALCRWVVGVAADSARASALAAHFAADDRLDGTFHAGVETALAGMATFPRQYQLKKGHGFFNDDGYWRPEDYIALDAVSASEDPFAQWVRVMKAAAIASVETIRDDAQVNRDNLGAVVEPLVQWVNRFGPLALFVPGGEGWLALAGLIDAGFGLEQATQGQTVEQRSAGMTRTLFGLLNALPMVEAGAVIRGEEGGLAEAATVGNEAPGLESAITARPASAVAAPFDAAAQRLYLLRGLGALTGGFSDEVLRQIGRICDLSDEMLATMQAGRRPLAPILADTLDRFRIDQALDQEIAELPAGSADAERALGERTGQFETRYARLQQSAHEWVRLFQSQYPGLPKAVIEQMLERSGVDIAAPHSLADAKRMLGKLDGKARQCEFQVRLARAYEGLYLRSVANADSDVLILHSLECLPGWPASVRIEVREGSVTGRLLDSIGAPGTSPSRQLIKHGTAYQGATPAQRVSLWQALLNGLSPGQRTVIGLRADYAMEDLQSALHEHARPRAELEPGLQRMDAGLPFDRSGLRGGGFPSTPQSEVFSLTILKLQVRELYPRLVDSELDALLLEWGVNAQNRLVELNLQWLQLHGDLREWVDAVEVDIADMEVDLILDGDDEAEGLTEEQIEEENAARITEAMDTERQSRSGVANQLLALWQLRGRVDHRAYADGELVGYSLDLDYERFHRLPSLSIQFPEVTQLTMADMSLTERRQLPAFLEAFPQLRTLDLSAMDLRLPTPTGQWRAGLPPAILKMHQLTRLNLRHTGLTLTEATAGALDGLTRLVDLDLSFNPLGTPPVVLSLTALRRLNLRGAGLHSGPVGMLDRPYFERLDLRDNQLTRIAPAVRLQSVARDAVLLSGNPITDLDSLQWIGRHRQQTGFNVWMGPPNADFAQPDAWLTGFSMELAAGRVQRWQRLAAVARSERLFSTLAVIRRTAEFRTDYGLWQQRVWQLIEALDGLPALRSHVFEDVQWSALDSDDPFAGFRRLEARVAAFHSP